MEVSSRRGGPRPAPSEVQVRASSSRGRSQTRVPPEQGRGPEPGSWCPDGVRRGQEALLPGSQRASNSKRWAAEASEEVSLSVQRAFTV